MPTGDPNCPPHVKFAKHIFWKIVQATNGSMGESYAEGNLSIEEDDKEYDDEDDNEDVGKDGEDDDDANDQHGGRGEHLLAPVDIFGHVAVRSENGGGG